MTPLFAVVGMSGGELVVVLVALMVVAAGLVSIPALVYFFVSRAKKALPTTCPHCGKCLSH